MYFMTLFYIPIDWRVKVSFMVNPAIAVSSTNHYFFFKIHNIYKYIFNLYVGGAHRWKVMENMMF